MDHDQTALEAGRASEGSGKVRVAPVLRIDLEEELRQLKRQEGYTKGEPTGKTLVKEPDLRVVLMALVPGARLEEHSASGPIAIQAIEGRLRLALAEGSVELAPGQMLALEPWVRHDVEGLEASAFLLTIGRTTYHDVGAGHHQPDGSQV